MSERHFQVVQWLRDIIMANKKDAGDAQEDEGDDDKAMKAYAFEDEEEMTRMKHMLEHGYRHFRLAHPVVTASGQEPIWNGILTHRVQSEFCRAAEEGRAESVQWLINHGPIVFLDFKQAFNSAVRGGQLDMMRLLHRLFPGGDYYGQAVRDAASSGHLQALQWRGHNLRTPRNAPVQVESSTIELAAGNGHLDVVQWFHV